MSVFRSLLLTVVVISGLTTGGAASASTAVVSETDSEPYAEWINEAVAPTPNVTVQVSRSQFCAASFDVVGCSDYDETTAAARIFIEPGFSGDGARGIFLHELGHLFELAYLYPSDRPEVKALLGFSAGESWRNSSGVLSPQEWFADAAFLCFSGHDESGLGLGFNFRWNSPEIQAICSFMGQAARRPVRKLTAYSISVPPRTRFMGTLLFSSGTLSASLRVGRRTWSSVGSCTDRLGDRRRFAFVNTCGRRVMVANRGVRSLRVRFQGVPAAVPTARAAGALSPLSVRPSSR